MGSVRVAIVGVGNCASSLVQGVEYYRDADPNERVPGLMHVTFGEYHVSDVEFVAAFDVDAKKVGRDLAEAIVASENNTIKISDVPPTGVTVQRGPTLDGLGKYYRETVEESDEEPVDVAQALRDARVDVVVSYLPVGSDAADKFYAQAAIDAGCGFVNALPVFIASDPVWAAKFEAAGLPIVGDVPLNVDLKLEVWDSPNSAGIIIDAVRACKIALDRKIAGPLLSASGYFMKSPPVQYPDPEARDAVERFIHGDLPR